MFGVNNDSGTTEARAFSPAISEETLFFTNGSEATGQPGTILDADFMNMILLEGANLVKAGGMKLEAGNCRQWLDAIQALIKSALDKFAGELNPEVEIPVATTEKAGIVELATNTEAQTGSDAVRAITPAALSSRTATEARSGILKLASPAMASAGTDTQTAVTPAGLLAAINAILKGVYALNPIGKIEFWPFRAGELPSGWYACDGAMFGLLSPQGLTLNSFSASFKSDWRIVATDSKINVPNFFDEEGRGAFMRAVDGSARKPGTWEGDAIRNIVGEAGPFNHTYGAYGDATGVFTKLSQNAPGHINSNGACGRIRFDASKVVPTADENRPINIGMTPAIFLGV